MRAALAATLPPWRCVYRAPPSFNPVMFMRWTHGRPLHHAPQGDAMPQSAAV